ncbi:DUF4129 domain-containing protein [Flavobacterium subsaxonicum]|uniref:DUF4129 domain-containing protein n=1 Tax=Flavobacterium subsaxonicum TaxID=426226 RepID=UPI00041D939A|nr:DUF4129 domain-containing protein [Flavobacterium subsaxonicum]
MNKFILYIALLCCPLFVTAQQDADTIVADTTYTSDTVTGEDAETYTEDPPKMAVKKMALPQTAAVAPVVKARTFDARFKEKYDGNEYKYQVKAATKTWWDRFLEWLGNILDAIFGGSGKKSDSNWTGLIIRILAIAIIGFVVYLIARAVLNKEGMWIFGRSRGNIGSQDADAENIHEMDFSSLIDQTKANADYKLAVRYYYLWLLKKLSNREIIDWHWDKTNTDYLYEIKDTLLRNDFEYLSYVYDHSWYGDFPVDEKNFAKAERAFKKTINTL